MKDDGFFDSTGWRGVSDKDRRDPLGALHDLQNKMAEIEAEIDERQSDLGRHEMMLEYLRSIVRKRMGEPVETPASK